MKTTRAVPCARILERVSRYLDGELSAAECRAIKQHCRRCPRCGGQAGAFCQAVGLCRSAGRRRVPKAVTRRAAQSVRQLLKAESGRR